MLQTVADILVGTLEQIGIKQIFGLIGDSLNPLADAVRRSKIEWIGVRPQKLVKLCMDCLSVAVLGALNE